MGTLTLLLIIKYLLNSHSVCTSQLNHCLLSKTHAEPLDKVKSAWYTISSYHAPPPPPHRPVILLTISCLLLFVL